MKVLQKQAGCGQVGSIDGVNLSQAFEKGNQNIPVHCRAFRPPF
jgi:hypothetical protein